MLRCLIGEKIRELGSLSKNNRHPPFRVSLEIFIISHAVPTYNKIFEKLLEGTLKLDFLSPGMNFATFTT